MKTAGNTSPGVEIGDFRAHEELPSDSAGISVRQLVDTGEQLIPGSLFFDCSWFQQLLDQLEANY